MTELVHFSNMYLRTNSIHLLGTDVHCWERGAKLIVGPQNEICPLSAPTLNLLLLKLQNLDKDTEADHHLQPLLSQPKIIQFSSPVTFYDAFYPTYKTVSLVFTVVIVYV